MGAGARAKDFQDQAGAIDDLGLPAPLQVALLHRRQRAVDDDQADLLLGDRLAQRIDAALAEQRSRYGPREAHDLAADHVEVDGAREADRLVEPRVERSP